MVSGEVVEQANLVSFDAVVNPTTKMVTFITRIKNNGNVQIRPKGKIHITRAQDEEYEVVFDGLTILPGATRKHETEWKPVARNENSTYSAILAAEYGKNNSIQYVITSARDITRMKESEQELIEINQTFETLTNNSPLGIIIFNLEKENRKNNIYYVNKKAEDILGFSKDELNTIILEDYLYNTKDEESFQYLIKHKDSFERRSKILRFKTKHNKLKILEVELTSIDVETTVYTLFTFIDVTKYYKHIYNK